MRSLVTLFLVLVFTRSDVQTSLLRAPGSLFQQMPDGRISNIYTLRILNKTSREFPVELRLEDAAGSIKVLGAGTLLIPKENSLQTSVLIEMARADLKGASTPLIIGVYSEGKRLETVKTAFVGPRQ